MRTRKAPAIYSPVSEPTRGRKTTRGRRPGRGLARGAPLSPPSEDPTASASTGGASDVSTGDGNDSSYPQQEPMHSRMETYIKAQASALAIHNDLSPLHN